MWFSPLKYLLEAVDLFWDTVPPFWRMIQKHIRAVGQEKFNITVEQFHILRNIRMGRNSVSQLAEFRNISRPAISQCVELLVIRGLVTRTTDPQDRRHIKLDLTPAGNDLIDAIFDDTRIWMVDLFSLLDPGEVQALTLSLDFAQKSYLTK